MKRIVLTAAVSVLMAASLANAGSAVLGGSGWQAVWDASLNPYVNIIYDSETTDAVRVRKIAEFIQGPDEFGLFPTIPITFQQTGPSSISRIVILDETLTNSTKVGWTDFHWDLLDHGETWFIHDSGWSFATEPLVSQHWSNNDTSFSVDGFADNGVVPNGGVWKPGLAYGELVINVVSKTAPLYTTFTLKETPTPEPASLLLIAIGFLLLRRR
jgi:hypothetical protein